MNIDMSKFFDGFRHQFGTISQVQVDALNALFDKITVDPKMTDAQWLAYMLATAYHETAHTFQPIAEIGKGKGRPYGVKDPVTLQTYYGRGFVQLTWKRNYQKFATITGLDLVNHPELALQSGAAYQIMETGMIYGLFTGKKLGDYINHEKVDYVNARRIINGTDRAELIAGYAHAFEAILNGSATFEPAPTEPEAVPEGNAG